MKKEMAYNIGFASTLVLSISHSAESRKKFTANLFHGTNGA
jgi:hypothetical protein